MEPSFEIPSSEVQGYYRTEAITMEDRGERTKAHSVLPVLYQLHLLYLD